MKMRRIVAFAVMCVLIVSSMPFRASAFTAEEKLYVSEMMSPLLQDSPGDMKTSVKVLKEYVDTDSLKERAVSAISECSASVNVSDFDIPVSIAEYVADFIWYNIPEAFNVYQIGYSTYGTEIYLLSFSYRDYADTKDEYAACYAQFMSAANKLLAGIENNTTLSEVEKALLLHDRLALWTEYDYVSSSAVKHTAYGAFGRKAAVCQGYAMAYMYLLQRVGIDNYYCSSESLNHGWNIVFIDNKPYHVDVTWDDRAWGKSGRGFTGRVDHDNFLRSTAGIKETGHTASDFDATPVDTTYDNYFWQNSSSAFQIVDNEIYYIDSKNEVLKRLRDDKTLCGLSDIWSAEGNYYWTDNYACLSSAGGDLFYSLSDGVYKYTISANSSKKIFSPALGTGLSVFGFTYEDGYLICDINNTPNNADNLSQVKQTYSDITPAVSAVEINDPCTKTEYYIGDRLDLSGLRLKVTYSDNSYEIISEGFTCSGFSSDSDGTKTVYVSYKGFSDRFSVAVKTPYVDISEESITVTEQQTVGLNVVTAPYGVSVSWSSSADNISVSDAKVTALKMGGAVVTATISYNGAEYFDTCEITVLCDHSASVLIPEKPATCISSGHTAGVYCSDCKTYISGYEELPKLNAVFTDSATAQAQGNIIKCSSGLTVGDILKQASKDSVIKDKTGNAVSSDAAAVTGMKLILPCGKEYTIAVMGDVNSDGKITAADARFVLRVSVGLESIEEGSAQFTAANINGGNIAASDARHILRASVALENHKAWLS